MFYFIKHDYCPPLALYFQTESELERLFITRCSKWSNQDHKPITLVPKSTLSHAHGRGKWLEEEVILFQVKYMHFIFRNNELKQKNTRNIKALTFSLQP